MSSSARLEKEAKIAPTEHHTVMEVTTIASPEATPLTLEERKIDPPGEQEHGMTQLSSRDDHQNDDTDPHKNEGHRASGKDQPTQLSQTVRMSLITTDKPSKRAVDFSLVDGGKQGLQPAYERASMMKRHRSKTALISASNRISQLNLTRGGSTVGRGLVKSISILIDGRSKVEQQLHLDGELYDAVDIAFDGIDHDGSGTIEREELIMFVEEAAKHVGLKVDKQIVEIAVEALIEDIIGEEQYASSKELAITITRADFHGLFEKHPELFYVFESKEDLQERRRSVVSELSKKTDEREQEKGGWDYDAASSTWRNSRVAIIWVTIYVLANIVVFVFKAVKYANNEDATAVFGNCVIVARGSAAVLNLNAFVILLPMCRHLLTYMRCTWFRFIFPYDIVLDIHMTVGVVFAIFSASHVLAHICDMTRFADASEEDLVALFGTKLGDEIPQGKLERWKLLLSSRVGITGIIMVVCMVIAYLTIRGRRKRFNTFWYAHHLLLVMLIALCIHGTGNLLEPHQSVYWVAVPLGIYMFFRLFRETPVCQAKILNVEFKQGDVVALQLEKPRFWCHVQAGMYAFLKIPAASCFEWHPFTLTSAPTDDYIEFHIRKLGDWTGKAHHVLQSALDGATTSTHTPTTAATLSNASSTKNGMPKFPRINASVEGPLGASSQGFSDYPVVVLVGAGIGVTPMVSVLKSLLAKPGKMKKCYFYWTVRDRESFEWFATLMDDIYASDHQQRHMLTVRNFLTSALHDSRDLGSVLLYHAARAEHKRSDFDLLLGRRAHRQVDIGRPRWEDELQSIKRAALSIGHRSCGIFMCGPEVMGAEIKKVAIAKSSADFHFYFTKEVF